MSWGRAAGGRNGQGRRDSREPINVHDSRKVMLQVSSSAWSVPVVASLLLTARAPRQAVSCRIEHDGKLPIDVQQVQRLLQDRDEARAARDFETADDLQAQLRSRFNVVVSDSDQTWYVIEDEPMDVPAVQKKTSGYSRDPRDEADVDVQAIEEILAERKSARRKQEFHLADELRQRLIDEFNVVVKDTQKLWYVDSKRKRWNYESKEKPHREIEDLLERRDHCRRRGDFETADDIRTELARRFSVRVSDRDRSWSFVAPAQGPDAGRGHRYSQAIKDSVGVSVSQMGRNKELADGADFSSLEYTLSGDGQGLDIPTIERLLSERSDAKRQRNYERADSLHAQLTSMSVAVDDGERTYAKVHAGGYKRVGPPGDGDAIVEDLILRRLLAKRTRDFETADKLLQRIKSMRIRVDDRALTWCRL